MNTRTHRKRPKGKVLVAMSGGVDSSVAAALLKEEGYEVVGCFMRLGSPGESLDQIEDETGGGGCDPSRVKIGHQGCCSINDAKDAELVAAKLGIGFYVLNFKRDFRRVIDYFIDDYNAGRTPNPCVRCNDWLKFGKLDEYARSIDADWVASGHYACVERVYGEPALLRGVDRSKDQSYVLFGSPLADLSRMLLPIGGYRKEEIRDMAREMGLGVGDKPDSQEICFVPDMDYAGLIKRQTPEAVRPGAVLDKGGRVIGEHEGHQHFTIGQRRGVRVALGYPIYVVGKDSAANTITVGRREDLAAHGLVADGVNWLVAPSTGEARECEAKIRYNADPVPARVQSTGEDELRVWFDQPQDAVAPGQAVVCYEGDRVLGGGWIRQALTVD
ncbi:MAG: tRNA 2-thiouridine(34) synthase MnmA [Planctomycetota bacterium]|jgi:tRNA-specific 2-thiouridylase